MVAATARPQQRSLRIADYSGMCTHSLVISPVTVAGFPSTAIQNGAKVFAMRHGRKVKKLGRPADQRKALLRGLVTELLRHGKIKTTKVRAKAMRRYVDKIITLAKKGTLHTRRQALAYVYDKELVKNVFKEAPERYAERNGGYCRVIPEIKRRRGDNAEMAVIELV